MSEIKVDTLTGKTTANDITVTVGATATQSLRDGLVKHFSNFDGRGNTFYGSFNASSITDNATGDYTITVTTAFSGTSNMAFTGIAQDQQSSNKHQPPPCHQPGPICGHPGADVSQQYPASP